MQPYSSSAGLPCWYFWWMESPVGISGGWSPEIPDIGGLLRLLRIGGGGIIADCPPPYPGGLQINKRT